MHERLLSLGNMPVPAAVVVLACGLLTGCATDWSRYPWADRTDQCERARIGGGQQQTTLSPIPVARGVVVGLDGQALANGLHYRVEFADGRGSQIMLTRSADFALCIDGPPARWAAYYWVADVRASPGGPILFSTPVPQPFDPTAPIRVMVTPLN